MGISPDGLIVSGQAQKPAPTLQYGGEDVKLSACTQYQTRAPMDILRVLALETHNRIFFAVGVRVGKRRKIRQTYSAIKNDFTPNHLDDDRKANPYNRLGLNIIYLYHPGFFRIYSVCKTEPLFLSL